MMILSSGNDDVTTYTRMQEFLKQEAEKEKKKNEPKPHTFTLGQTVALFCLLSIPIGLASNILFAMMAVRYMEALKSVIH